MQTIIDAEGRIPLVPEMLGRMGLQPGDPVILELRDGECVIRSIWPKSGLTYEGIVLVHHGSTATASEEELLKLRAEQLDRLTPGLPE